MLFIKRILKMITSFIKNEADTEISYLDDDHFGFDGWTAPGSLVCEQQVKNDAIFAAQNDRPDSSSAVPDANEDKYKQFFKNKMRELNRQATKKLFEHRSNIIGSSISDNVEILKNLKESCEQEALHNTQANKQVLEVRQNYKDQLHKDLITFQSENGLIRTAQYPEQRIIKLILLILPLAIIEMFFNTLFLSKGHDYGLLGGFGYALFFTLINIYIFAWHFGKLFRHINNRIKTWKVLTYISIPIYCGVAIGYNYFIALFREEYEINSETAFTNTMHNLMNPGSIDSIESAGLLIMGFFIIFLPIAYKVYKSDDKYPGYGSLDRRFKIAEASYHKMREDIIAELKSLKNAALDELGSLKFKIKTDNDDIIGIIDDIKLLDTRYNDCARYINDMAIVTLKTYRETNTSYRKTASPEYFQKIEPLFSESVLNIYNKQSLDKIKSKLPDMEEIHAVASKLKTDLLEIFNAVLKHLEEIDKYFHISLEEIHEDDKLQKKTSCK